MLATDASSVTGLWRDRLTVAPSSKSTRTRPPLMAQGPGRRKEPVMYIGLGTILVVVLIVLAFKLVRRV